MEYWSVGCKSGKNLIYILSPLFPTGAKQGSFFFITPPLQHSNTPNTIKLRHR